MKCQSCGKKEAIVRYMEDINGKKQELFFCSDCAENLGFVNFSDIFSPLFITVPKYNKQEILKCNNCGYSFEDYAKTGFFGCPNCYNSFESKLDELFLKLHGKNRHIELKANKKSKVEKEDNIENLKIKLHKLIKEEKYEEAAVVRDKIKEITGK